MNIIYIIAVLATYIIYELFGVRIIKGIYIFIEFLCINVVTRHILIIIGKTLFNIGNAALFFSISGLMVSMLNYPSTEIVDFSLYGIIMTISGYLLSHCKKNLIKRGNNGSI